MEETTLEMAKLPLERLSAGSGCVPNSLGQRVALPRLPETRRHHTAALKDGSVHEHKYASFSLGEYYAHQVPVSHLETLSDLSLGPLQQQAPLRTSGLEATFGTWVVWTRRDLTL